MKRIKELFESNPIAMWSISFLLLVIVVFTPVLMKEYENYQYEKATSISDFEWEQIQRNEEEKQQVKQTITDQYTVIFNRIEDGQDMKEDGTMFNTRWLWFDLQGEKKSIAFNYNGKEAVDNRGTPLVKGVTYIVSQNMYGEVLDIDRQREIDN